MSVYRLTRTETWALTSLSLPPFTQESRLLGWLGETPPPDLDQYGPASFNTLEAKGYYHPSNPHQPIDPALAQALSLFGAASLELNALIRRGSQATLAFFALAGDGAVQYMIDDDSLILHPPLHLSELGPQLLPSWFAVQHAENFESQISLTAFLIFKEACLLQDIDEVLEEAETGSLSRSELVDYFQKAANWVDIYHEMGIKGVPDSRQMPIASGLNELLNLGMLIEVGDGRLQVSQAAAPFHNALSDLDYCSITFSLETPEEHFPETAIFLYGGQRLFLLEIKLDQIKIQQMANKNQGSLWLGDLFARAGQMPLQAIYPDEPAESPAQPVEATLFSSPPPPLAQPSVLQSPQAAKFCEACGTQLNPGSRFCSNCGTRVNA